MNILALDTSSSACSVALLANEQVVTRHEVAPMQQAKLILSFIDDILTSQNMALKQLDAIAFGCGPGSFTGVRIGVSVAQGLAYAVNLPLISVSSLAATAQAAYEDLGWEKLIVAVDARIQEVYWGAYEVRNGLVQLVAPERVCMPEHVILAEKKGFCGIGNAWEVYRDQIPYLASKIDITRLPMASAILSLAKPKVKDQEWTPASDALPVYLRNDVAIKNSSN
jgi:tRNA threonylcarbamoyladenosine biosynthesis protein TsaB